jgi:hypothetical protein
MAAACHMHFSVRRLGQRTPDREADEKDNDEGYNEGNLGKQE